MEANPLNGAESRREYEENAISPPIVSDPDNTSRHPTYVKTAVAKPDANALAIAVVELSRELLS